MPSDELEMSALYTYMGPICNDVVAFTHCQDPLMGGNLKVLSVSEESFQKVQNLFLTIKMYQVLKDIFRKRVKSHRDE